MRGAGMELSVALDKELHGIIGEASGNRLIMVILRALAETIDSFIDDMHRRIMSNEDLGKRLLDAHQGIVLALVDRNGPEAVRMMREHFRVVDEAIFSLVLNQDGTPKTD